MFSIEGTRNFLDKAEKIIFRFFRQRNYHIIREYEPQMKIQFLIIECIKQI